MKALIIQHARNEGPGLLLDVLKAHDWKYQINLMDQTGARLPDSITGYDAFIIMGGSMGAYEEHRYPYLIKVQELIRQAREKQIQTLGICLGAQLIARALGAYVGQNPVKEIGWYPLELTEAGQASPLFKGLPVEQTVFHWHGDTFAVPRGASLLARGKTCHNQAFEIDDSIWALQFHPEVTPRIISDWTRVWSDELTDFRGKTGCRVLEEKTRDCWEYNRDYRVLLLENIEGILSRRLSKVR